MRTKILLQLLSLVLLLAISIVAGCGSSIEEETANNTEQSTETAADANIGHVAGKVAPNFSIKRLDGSDLVLNELRGKVVMIDFWDTWCPPCLRAMPHLQELSEIYHDDLVVVGVSLGQQGAAKVQEYVNKTGITFEIVVLAPGNTVLEDFGGITGIPTSFLLDADGVIRKVWTGGADLATYEKAVKAALNPVS